MGCSFHLCATLQVMMKFSKDQDRHIQDEKSKKSVPTFPQNVRCWPADGLDTQQHSLPQSPLAWLGDLHRRVSFCVSNSWVTLSWLSFMKLVEPSLQRRSTNDEGKHRYPLPQRYVFAAKYTELTEIRPVNSIKWENLLQRTEYIIMEFIWIHHVLIKDRTSPTSEILDPSFDKFHSLWKATQNSQDHGGNQRSSAQRISRKFPMYRKKRGIFLFDRNHIIRAQSEQKTKNTHFVIQIRTKFFWKVPP